LNGSTDITDFAQISRMGILSPCGGMCVGDADPPRRTGTRRLDRNTQRGIFKWFHGYHGFNTDFTDGNFCPGWGHVWVEKNNSTHMSPQGLNFVGRTIETIVAPFLKLKVVDIVK